MLFCWRCLVLESVVKQSGSYQQHFILSVRSYVYIMYYLICVK